MDLVVDQREAVEAHLRRLGWIGTDEPLLELSSAGEGNMNRTLRARLPERTLILKQAVPYVARYPQIPAPVNRLDAEAAFYRALSGSDELRRHTPALLGEDPGEHLLCLEDLGDAGDFTRIYDGGPRPGDGVSFDTLARWLGRLHAVDVSGLTIPENRAMRELNHAHIFEVPFDAGNGVALPAPLASAQVRLAASRPLRERARALGARYLGQASAPSGAVLLHGDYYPGSWLERPDGSVAVIDPEFGFAGVPEFDVGVFRAHLTFAGLDDADIDGHLSHYHRPGGFDEALARAFAGMEIIRRLLGVAQLPLAADDDTRLAWLQRAREDLNP